MKWRKKAVRSLSLLLVLAMCLGMAAFSVSAEQGETDPCANGHSWSEMRTVVEATCVQKGESARTCTVCGETQTSVILQTAHSWVNKAEAATVGKEGREYRVCSNCGKDETVKILPKLEQKSNTSGESGSASLSKLSRQEIIDLLNSAPTTMPGDIFVTTPSCASPYQTDKVRTEVLEAVKDRLNVLRRIAGLPAVTLDSAMCEEAQYGAVILGKLGTLSHTPSKPADMDDAFYKKAYSATSSSNIYAGLALMSTPDGFMDDSDGSNVDRLGHRRWQLNPALGKVGFGYVDNGNGYRRFTTEKVFDKSGRTTDYDYIAWPASGNFPSDLSCFEADTAWSVSLNPSCYQKPAASAVTVSLTRESDGKTWSFSGRNSYQASSSGLYFNIDNAGYGVDNCIIFRPDGISKYEGVYTVSIQGLKDRNGAAAGLTYQVDFFATKGGTPTTPTTPTEPTNPTTPTITVDNIPAWGTAYVSNQTVTVDGRPVQFQMYALKNANGDLTNYIKLRDMAYILNGTKAQFAVGYDGTISLTTGRPYAVGGTEMTTPFSGNRGYRGGAQGVKVNGTTVNMTAITLTDADGGDYNYFKLRDLGKALGFNVGYSNASGVFIETDKPSPE